MMLRNPRPELICIMPTPIEQETAPAMQQMQAVWVKSLMMRYTRGLTNSSRNVVMPSAR